MVHPPLPKLGSHHVVEIPIRARHRVSDLRAGRDPHHGARSKRNEAGAIRPGTYAVVDHIARDEKIAFDTLTGHAHALYRQRFDVSPGSPEAMAREALAARSVELGLHEMPGALVLEEVVESTGAFHVRFRQAVGDVPVFRGDVVVSISKRTPRAGSILSNVRFDAPRSLAVPVVSGDEALSIGRRYLELVGQAIGSESAGLSIYKDRLAWLASLPNMEPLGDWLVVVDAVSGDVVKAWDQALYVDGSGVAFDPDPLTTAEANYGEGGFVDNGDADSDDLNGERFPVTLPDITFTGGLYRLEGPHCKLVDFEAPYDGTAGEPDPDDFFYTRSQQGFEDVVVYHHIDKNQRYIQALGFDNIQNTPIECDPHGLNGQDNSHYIPSQNRLAWGEGCVDDAEDVDVVLHEYGHAIQHGTVTGWGGGEEGAMGEGFGDYWAGSYSRDVSEFHWNWVFNWDGHNVCWGGRYLDREWYYPDNIIGQVHHDGEIWSAALMKIWQEIGRVTTDHLILASHFYLGTYATMIDGAEAVVQADLDNNDGLNMDTLVEWFVHRGFFEREDWPLPVLAHSPLGDQGSTGPFTIIVFVQSDDPIAEVRLAYGIDGEATGGVVMTNIGLGRYEAVIPDQGDGLVQYYIAARTTTGFLATHPRPAPTDWHTFNAGTVGMERVDGARVTRLETAFPNPSSPATTVRFVLTEGGPVTLRVYDAAGREVRTLRDEPLSAGTFEISWDGKDASGRSVSSGVYVIRMESVGLRFAERLVLVK